MACVPRQFSVIKELVPRVPLPGGDGTVAERGLLGGPDGIWSPRKAGRCQLLPLSLFFLSPFGSSLLLAYAHRHHCALPWWIRAKNWYSEQAYFLLINNLKLSLPWNICLGEVDGQRCFLFYFHSALTYCQHPSLSFVFPSNFTFFTVIVWIGSLTLLS